MSIPPHNPLEWPSAIRVSPDVPVAPGVVSDIDASYHGPPSGQAEADRNAEGLIQKGYVLNPFAGEFSQSLIREGHLVFCARGTPGLENGHMDEDDAGISDSRPHSIFPLSMMNKILDMCWAEALTMLAAYKDRHLGLHDPRRPNLLKYLDLDEAAWTELYREGGKMIRGDPVWK
jgi:hypothetical protein